MHSAMQNAGISNASTLPPTSCRLLPSASWRFTGRQPFHSPAAAARHDCRRSSHVPAATGNAERGAEPTAGSSGAAKAASALSVADDVAAAAESLAGNGSAPRPQPGAR